MPTITPTTDRSEPTIHDVLVAIQGLGTRMGGLESVVGGLTVAVEKLDTNVTATNERITSSIAFSAVNIRRLTEESNEVRGSLEMAPGQMVTMVA